MHPYDLVKDRIASEDHLWPTTAPQHRGRAESGPQLQPGGRGGVATFTGMARIDDSLPHTDEHTAYLEEYRHAIERRPGMTPRVFADRCHARFRVALPGVRAW